MIEIVVCDDDSCDLNYAVEMLSGILTSQNIGYHINSIYMTSYEEYCMQAINKVHAFSFLCKPLNNHEMHKQVMEAVGSISHTDIEKEVY